MGEVPDSILLTIECAGASSFSIGCSEGTDHAKFWKDAFAVGSLSPEVDSRTG